MTALFEQDRALTFEIFTQVPLWFIRFSLIASDGTPVPFRYHAVMTDIGFVQDSAIAENVEATIERLNAFLPFGEALVHDLASTVQRASCKAVFCDIAPLGLVVAEAAGVPSWLVNNFTWSWIYSAYVDEYPALQPHIDYLERIVETADVHIQAEPVGTPHAHAVATVGPISRAPRQGRAHIRQLLHIPEDVQTVMVTMGGIVWNYTHLDRLASLAPIHVVIPGADPEQVVPPNVHLLAHDADLFHPDVIQSCDAVIGKVGYSTLAEICEAGIPFGYIPRPLFRESAAIERYVHEHMSGLAFTVRDLTEGTWIDKVPQVLAQPRYSRPAENGRDQVARVWQAYRTELRA